MKYLHARTPLESSGSDGCNENEHIGPVPGKCRSSGMLALITHARAHARACTPLASPTRIGREDAPHHRAQTPLQRPCNDHSTIQVRQLHISVSVLIGIAPMSAS